MKIRKSAAAGNDKVDMQMTPMIDIVFQLLTFFVMSFKIVTQEGDFNIKMPLVAGPSASADEPPLPPIRIRLTANDQGGLAGIQMGERPFKKFSELNEAIMQMVGTDEGPGLRSEAEAEIDADYNLHYSEVVQAITAISGQVTPDGHIVKLIEKLKFAPPKESQ